MTVRAWLGAMFLVALVSACTSVVRDPTPADVSWAQGRWSKATLADLQHGRRLYVGRCAGCHMLYAPSARSPEQWPAIIDWMAHEKRVDLAPAELDRIAWYLSTVSARASVTMTDP